MMYNSPEYKAEKAKYNAKFPNRDFDEYINGLVDEAREN